METVYGIVGALEAFPRRLAAKALKTAGNRLHRGITRQTTHVVFAHAALAKLGPASIEERTAGLRARDIRLVSENGLLRKLGLLPASPPSNLSRRSLLDQSRLTESDLDLLALFDGFERDEEPFSFRDLILARKYAGLIAGGSSWGDVALAVHHSGPVTSLTALSLRVGRRGIEASDPTSPMDLDGQRRLDFGAPVDEAEDYFALGENAEQAGLHAEAAVLYGQCLTLDPGDADAAFNRGNCLRAIGDIDEAAAAYMAAIKGDPRFVEAWFNFGGLWRDAGNVTLARKHLNRAVEIDPNYADAVFNLASLEYDAGRLADARRWWARYLELDATSDWAKTAQRGIAYVDRQTRKNAG